MNAVLTKNEKHYGYDAQDNRYGDMIDMGIIDPKKVVRLALQNAASISGLIATTEASIADKPEKKDDAPAEYGRYGRWVVWAVWAVWAAFKNAFLTFQTPKVQSFDFTRRTP